MKNLVIRSLSGILYVALIVAALTWPEPDNWLFIIVFALFIMQGIAEVHTITAAVDKQRQPWPLVLLDALGGVAVFLSFYYAHQEARGEQVNTLLWTLPVPVYGLVRMTAQLFLPRLNAVTSITRSALAVAYVSLPVALLSSVAAITNQRMLLALFVFIWLNDTGAFLVGSAVGKHRLFERVSPKKSWEGVAGGILFTLLGAWCMFNFANEFFGGPRLRVWLGMALVVSVFATLGDLFESLLKRTAGVKDSGHLIPGHGGILDRIDSLLFVVPSLLIYFLLFS